MTPLFQTMTRRTHPLQSVGFCTLSPVPQEAHFAAELGDVVQGKVPGRTAAYEVTLFKSVGVAIQDLCAASRALANARQLGLGTPLHSEEQP